VLELAGEIGMVSVADVVYTLRMQHDPGLHPLAGLLQELARAEIDVVRVPGIVSS